MPVFRFRNTHAALKKIRAERICDTYPKRRRRAGINCRHYAKGRRLKRRSGADSAEMMACAALPQEKAAQLYTLLYELLNTLEKIESKLKKGGKPYCYSFSRP